MLDARSPGLVDSDKSDVSSTWSGAAYFATEDAVLRCPPLQSWRRCELGVVMMVKTLHLSLNALQTKVSQESEAAVHSQKPHHVVAHSI